MELDNLNVLERKFHDEMLNIYDTAKTECNYIATRFYKMVLEHGGLNAAKQLLAGDISEGITRLWKENRLDISMEATIIQDPWQKLFSDNELAIARKRLKDLGYYD